MASLGLVCGEPVGVSGEKCGLGAEFLAERTRPASYFIDMSIRTDDSIVWLRVDRSGSWQVWSPLVGAS